MDTVYAIMYMFDRARFFPGGLGDNSLGHSLWGENLHLGYSLPPRKFPGGGGGGGGGEGGVCVSVCVCVGGGVEVSFYPVTPSLYIQVISVDHILMVAEMYCPNSRTVLRTPDNLHPVSAITNAGVLIDAHTAQI